MFFRMAICAEQDAFADFRPDFVGTSVCQRAHVHFESLVLPLPVMPGQSREVAIVTAARASAVELRQERKLALQSARLLRGVTLVMMVRVLVLADARAVLSLPAGQWVCANETAAFRCHM
jgi:hypothetical protein